MSESIETADLIPAEQLQHFESWQLPSWEGSGPVVGASAKRARRVVAEPVPEPMTAAAIEEIRQQAYQEGLALGKQEGVRQGQAEINKKVAQLERVMEQLMQPIAAQQEALEHALINLTRVLAEAVVQQVVTFDADSLLQVVRQAIAQLPDGAQHIQLILHPQDAELIGRCGEVQAQDWKIIPDASLVSGGCIVKTDFSYVDFTLQQQFQLTVAEMVKRQLSHADQHETVDVEERDQ